MRIISLNLNGIRAAARKDFFSWLNDANADIVCLQETKAQQAQLQNQLFYPKNYHCYYYDAQKPGYSGTAIYSKIAPQKMITGLGFDVCDSEGRYLQADFEKLSVVSLYLPSGSSGEEKQARKYIFLDHFYSHLKKLSKQNRPWIFCGDWNIAHKKIDLKNWRSNQKNSGFLPEERAWMDKIIDQLGYVDAFRTINPESEQYTWWSNRGRAWEKNVGWRIDYQVVSPKLKPFIQNAFIYKEQRFSDHAPLIMDYALELN